MSLLFQASDEVDTVIRRDRLGFKAALILLLALGAGFGIVGWLRRDSLNTVAKDCFAVWAGLIVWVWGVLPIYFEFRARVKEIYGNVSAIDDAVNASKEGNVELRDPIRRRSLYVRVEHPTPQRETDIIASRTPGANTEFHREMAGIALSFRNYSLEKPPSVSEIIDFANALQLLGTDHVTEEHRDVLLPFLAKTEKDRRHLLLREGFKSLLDDGARFAEKMVFPGGPES